MSGVPTEELPQPALEALWKKLGVAEAEAETVGLTLVPNHGVADPLEDLPSLVDDAHPRLILADPLAEGGMAVIYRAHQRPLRREVAVKSLKPSVRSDRTRGQLLREGRITGSLEHPNVIPVHALGLDRDGEPILVMKRVEGVVWREFLRAPDGRSHHLQGDTPLDWNLDVLLQVARAIDYAHRKGVVHRDVKPDNVMIGEFGEVYLLDWGIAVQTRGGAASVEGMAGTPAYMAPEMVGSPGQVITAQTDVYLLGAVLHELLTGRPPHHGQTLYSAMLAAYRSVPAQYPEDAPPGLVEICRRAMQRDPSARYATAEAFRKAVDDWRQHRASHAVADEARERLAALLAMIGQGAPPTAVYRLFGAARFGFEQAARIWPANDEARDGLRATVGAMARYELSAGHEAAAEALVADLADLGAVPTDLQTDLAALQARARATSLELANLRAMERDLDVGLGADTRRRVTVGLGVVLAAIALLSGFLARHFAPAGLPAWAHLTHALLLFLLATAFIVANRATMLQNRVNRQISQMALATFAAGFIFRLLVAILGIPLLPLLPLELIVYAFGVLMMGLATSKAVAWSAAPLALAAFGCAWAPTAGFEWTAAGVLATLGLMATSWRTRA